MEISTTTPHSTASSETKNTSQIGGDFTTFLEMLTVQLKNQDPMNPMESSDFAVQLATFSSVEQQVQTNDLLKEILQDRGTGLTSFAELIGKPVRVEGKASFGAEPVEAALPGNALADTATLIVKDEKGTIVASLAVGTDRTTRLISPEIVPQGNFSVVVRYAQNGDELETVPVSFTETVSEIALTSGEAEIVLSNGLRLAPDEISAVLSS